MPVVEPGPERVAEPTSEPMPEPTPKPAVTEETAAGEGDAAPPPPTAAEFAEQAALLAARTDQLQRLQADFHNYRRRMQAEQGTWEERAQGRLLTDLLPVLDNLERAAAAVDHGTEDDIRQGVVLILRQFEELLTARGVARIAAVGQPFDPQIHEAMLQTDSDAVPDNHVLAELQAGYRYGAMILRPALVQVARNPMKAGE